jgi:predicted esterase
MSDSSLEPLLRHAPARVHGRYLVAPSPAAASHWLVGFHGYAQTAESFLPSLLATPHDGAWRTIAVQGLHPFYTRNDRDVVAHWMTRQDRERAIPDNITYVDTVLDQLAAEFGAPRAIVFAGFSQGAAMAYRAAVRGRHAAAAVFVVGGDVPPDVLDAPAERWPRVHVTAGRDDAWYGPERLEREVATLRGRGVRAEGLVVDGGHEWNAPVTAALGELLAGLARAR